jgi:hypothetical protein
MIFSLRVLSSAMIVDASDNFEAPTRRFP